MIKLCDITDLRESVLSATCDFKLLTESNIALSFKVNGSTGIDKVYITESTKSKRGYDIIFYRDNNISKVMSKVSKGRLCRVIESTAGIILN